MGNKTPLERLKVVAEALGVPYAVDRYDGAADEFCVYAIRNIRGACFAGNYAQEHVAGVKLHYIQPVNAPYMDKIFEIIRKMEAAGFTSPDVDISTVGENRLLEFEAECVV